MSTLQIGLLIIGAILVIAVYGYNLMQERRIRKRMDDAFKTTADPLLDSPPRGGDAGGDGRAEPRGRGERGERIEPGIRHSDQAGGLDGQGGSHDTSQVSHGPAAANAAPMAVAVAEIETLPEDEPVPAEIAEPASPALAGEPFGDELPDPEIECVARLQAADPIPGVVLMDAVEHRYAKPCRWVGRQVSGVWAQVRDAESYTEVAACLVLADRSGPVNEQGFNLFRQVIEELGHALPAAFIIGERADELKRAAALDAFCADVDVQIGLNLSRKDGGRWTGTRLRGVAEAAGFKLNGAGQLDYMSDENGLLLFRMHNREDQPLLAESMKLLSTGGVTLILDVPRASDPVRGFDQMRALAKRLAVTLDAELVDDNARPLTDAGLSTIRAQLQAVQTAMRAKGIEPGGTRALRLFC